MGDGWANLATRELQKAALELAERKLSGQQLREAKAFITGHWRKGNQLNNLVARLETLPDIVKPGQPIRQKLRLRGEAEINQMRNEREAGDSIRKIATRHGIAYTTARRYLQEAE